MSLPDVLLSLLREPMSGTELIRLFRGSVGHFWGTDLSQIYRSLETLERGGCVARKEVRSPRGPARKVYRLTAKGRTRLTAWVSRPPRLPQAKFEYLAQLFSVTAVDEPRERARELLTSLRDEARQSVAVLEAIDAPMSRAPGYPEALPAYLFYPWLTLRHGLLRRRAYLQWIEESLELLESRPASADEISEEQFAELIETLLAMHEKEPVP